MGLLRVTFPQAMSIVILILCLNVQTYSVALQSDIFESYQMGKSTFIIIVDEIQAAMTWKKYKFPRSIKHAGVLASSPLSPKEFPHCDSGEENPHYKYTIIDNIKNTNTNQAYFLSVRHLSDDGFEYRLSTPCITGEKCMELNACRGFSILVTRNFDIENGSRRTIWTSRIKPVPHENALESRDYLTMESNSLQMRKFHQLLYINDHLSMKLAENQKHISQKNPPVENGYPYTPTNSCFKPFPRGKYSPENVAGFKYHPAIFELEIIDRTALHILGHRIYVGRESVDSTDDMHVILFPESAFSEKPHVFIQLRDEMKAIFEYSEIVQVTREYAIVNINPYYCGMKRPIGMQSDIAYPKSLDWLAIQREDT